MLQAKTRGTKTNTLYMYPGNDSVQSSNYLTSFKKKKHLDINNVIYLEVTLGPRYNSSTFMFYCKLRSFVFSFKKNVDKNVDRMRGVEGDTKNMKIQGKALCC